MNLKLIAAFFLGGHQLNLQQLIPGPSVFVVMEREGTMNAASFEDVVREGDVLFAPIIVSLNPDHCTF